MNPTMNNMHTHQDIGWIIEKFIFRHEYTSVELLAYEERQTMSYDNILCAIEAYVAQKQINGEFVHDY